MEDRLCELEAMQKVLLEGSGQFSPLFMCNLFNFIIVFFYLNCKLMLCGPSIYEAFLVPTFIFRGHSTWSVLFLIPSS